MAKNQEKDDFQDHDMHEVSDIRHRYLKLSETFDVYREVAVLSKTLICLPFLSYDESTYPLLHEFVL